MADEAHETDDEPVFRLRARHPLAAAFVAQWVGLLRRGSGSRQEIAEAEETWRRMRRWRAKHVETEGAP